MFSQRLRWPLAANRLHRVLEEKRSASAAILDLTESNPTRAGLIYDEGVLLRAGGDSQVLLYEPDSHGMLPAREAVAGYYADHGMAIAPEALFLTASTSEAYGYLFKLLADPDAEILSPSPSYPLLDFLTALEAVQLRHYLLRYDSQRGWHIDLNTLENVITTKTKAIVLVHPHNPTGAFVKPEEVARLNALCREHDLALICDEVFLDYAVVNDQRRPASLVSNREALTFVLSGLSKISALPQMKLAWIHVNGPEALREQACARLEFIADTYLSAGTAVQLAARKLLALRHEMQQQIRARTEANYVYLLESCRARQEGKVLLREAGWYAILKISPEISEEELAVDLLQRDEVFVHPGYFFDFPQAGFLVLSLLAPAEVFQEGVERVLARLHGASIRKSKIENRG